MNSFFVTEKLITSILWSVFKDLVLKLLGKLSLGWDEVATGKTQTGAQFAQFWAEEGKCSPYQRARNKITNVPIAKETYSRYANMIQQLEFAVLHWACIY